MKPQRTFTDWFIKNFSNIFSVLGILLTLYFGIFYVPTWLEEAQNEREKNAQNELQQSIKELAFSDSAFKINEVVTLVHAKEITLKKIYLYSLSDILTKTQESFMEDKFLPLAKRKELFHRLEIVKDQLPKENENILNEKKKAVKGFGLWDWLSAILSILLATLGVYASYKKYQVEKKREDEINNVMQDSSFEENESSSYVFEEKIRQIITQYPGVSLLDTQTKDIDIEFQTAKNNFFVEVKFLKQRKVGLKTINQLIYNTTDKSGEAWLIYNTELTLLANDKVVEFNKQNNNIIIKQIKAKTPTDLEKQLPNLLE